ncbi:hypothetical protein [Hydrogenophaga sp. SL48]|uniref:hypothetical protein n=1 Tax=Hydrogenophaga sp. SL48 TaxID=2806347 RepID=UPI001F3DB57D|nr:hypothetical protein [Hydrogenophaga sp. SL48]UJW81181.1 hypothetical protein IM738_00030 [Hydrogenophaga sp. SL48]
MRSVSVLLLAFCCGVASADTTVIEDGCVKYLETSKVYNVRVNILDGEDLWPKYSWANVLTKYAIVFWDKDEATVIDISIFGLLMDTGVEGKDLQGRRWKVAKQPWC